MMHTPNLDQPTRLSRLSLPDRQREHGRVLGLCCLVLLVGVAFAAQSRAADLPAVGDGEHLWLVVEDPKPKSDDEPGLVIYHLHADGERGRMAELGRISGSMMPRGVAAGSGELVLVLADRRIEVIRPVMSPLLQRWLSERRTLPALPEGCALMSLAHGDRGLWALVRVESEQTLGRLDAAAQDNQPVNDDPSALNRALGLPEDFVLDPDQEVDPPAEQAQQPEDRDTSDVERDSGPEEPAENEEPVDEQQPETEVAEGDPAELEAEADEPSAPRVPAYRLIHLRGGKWASAGLPDGFTPPKRAVLLMRSDDDRPAIIVERQADSAGRGPLIRYTPVQPAEARSTEPGWVRQPIGVQRGVPGQWSATLVDRQIVLVGQRMRSAQTVSVQARMLRAFEPVTIGRMDLPTDGRANWSVLPWNGGVALVARPGPKLKEQADGAPADTPLGGLIVMNLDGRTLTDGDQDAGVVVLYQAKPTAMEGNADLVIQISTFVVAMILMMLFYRQAPRAEQIDLPDDVRLASFTRRVFSGLIDLLPGFWIAGAMYGITIHETILYWPGNGVAKVLPAMRPGFVVIVVTVVHTTLFEFITARSLGKWLTGLYVADLSGKPAPAGPSLVRALSRAFDLFAPLMLVLAVISPGRQRLGDILAKTTVVMRVHEPDEQQNQDDESDF